MVVPGCTLKYGKCGIKHELPGYDAVGEGSIGFQNPDHKSVNLRYKRYSLCTLLVLETFRINFWNNSSEKSSDFFYLFLINYMTFFGFFFSAIFGPKGRNPVDFTRFHVDFEGIKFSSSTKKKFEKREYGTEGSQVITDLSTNRACGCLTSQIGRDMVFSAKYGRTRLYPKVR